MQAPTPYLGALADVDVVELLDEVLECDPEGAWLEGRVRVRARVRVRVRIRVEDLGW